MHALRVVVNGNVEFSYVAYCFSADSVAGLDILQLPPKLLPGVAFITKVFIGGSDGCVMYRTPSLLNVGNGVLLAFTQCRQVSHGDASPQEIHMKTSDDNGRSWGPASVLPFSADPLHNSLHRAQTIFDSTTGAVFIFDDALAYPTTKHNDSHPCARY